MMKELLQRRLVCEKPVSSRGTRGGEYARLSKEDLGASSHLCNLGV